MYFDIILMFLIQNFKKYLKNNTKNDIIKQEKRRCKWSLKILP